MSSTDDNMKLAKKIRKYRKASRLTQKQFSLLMGVSVPTLKNYENGDSTPDAAFIARFATLYNVSPNDVLNANKFEHFEDAKHLIVGGIEADEETKASVNAMVNEILGN